jgi:subtilase family serine protease
MTAHNGALTLAGSTNNGGLPPGLDGSGQTIGLIEFDNYNDSDVSEWLALAGLRASKIGQVSRFDIAGGTPVSGCDASTGSCGTTEVLLDIAAALGTAPGAKIAVFDAPMGTDYYTVLLAASNQIEASGAAHSA